MKRKTLGTVVLAVTMATALVACSADPGTSQGDESAVSGGTIRVGLDIEVSSVDPIGNDIGQQSSLVLANAIYEPLLMDGPRGELVPVLAESLESDDLIDWTLILRPDLTFSDGTALDAAAVIAHIERAQNSESAVAQGAQEIIEIAEVDETTVEMTLAEANATFPRYFARNLGMIGSTTATDPEGSPLGAGPYRLVSLSAGSSLTVERNPEYAGNTPAYADEIVFQFLPDTDSRYQTLAAGTVDVVWIETPSLMTQAETDGLQLALANATTATAIFNTEQAPFNDPLARRAVQTAIDRDALLQVTNQGQGALSHGPISSQSEYQTGSTYPEFDPDAARALLEQYGQPLAFAYTTDAQPEAMARATAIQQMLGDVGIEMEIDVADAATWASKLFAKDFHVIEFVTSGYGDTGSAMTMFEADSFSNFGGYANAEVSALIDQARSATTPPERSDLYNAASELIVAEAAVLFFTESPSGFIASPKIGGLPDVSDRNVISVSPGEWWIK